MMSRVNESRIRGVLLGLAFGDGIGGPTQMALLLAESLTHRGSFEVNDIRQRYLSWWMQHGFDTGAVAESVFHMVSSGAPWREAAELTHLQLNGLTAGCNPAHRAVPLATAAFINDHELPLAAIQEAAITHFDPLAGDVSAATVMLCRSLIQGLPWREALSTASDGRNLITQTALFPTKAVDISSDGYAPHVLQAAIHFLSSSDSFQPALEASMEFAGPPNYCPVLVGSIGGARWGASSISRWPHARTSVVERIDRVVDSLTAGLQTDSEFANG